MKKDEYEAAVAALNAGFAASVLAINDECRTWIGTAKNAESVSSAQAALHYSISVSILQYTTRLAALKAEYEGTPAL